MRARFLVFVIVCLVFLFPVFSCCAFTEEPPAEPDNIPSNYDCSLPENGSENKPHYRVYADVGLSAQEKLAISDSLQEWCVKTNGTMRYNLTYTDMTKKPETLSDPHSIRVYVTDPGPGYVGWATWQAGSFSAYIKIHPGLDQNTFRKVMLHELGHSFDLHFGTDTHYGGPYLSVMYPSIGDSSEHLGCPELTSFCDKYGCKAECANVGAERSSLPLDNRKL